MKNRLCGLGGESPEALARPTGGASVAAMPYAPDVIEAVMALAAAGLTRSQIAAKVGMTRSAVIGICWRRDVAAPTKEPKPAKPRRPRTITLKAKPSKPLPIKSDIMSNLPGVSWGDLQHHHCLWPLDGDRWCGEAKRDGSYCTHHARLAYRPAIARQHHRAA